MRTVCKQNSCTGCMACVGKCKKEAISIQDSCLAYNAVVDEEKCVSCGACEQVCPNNHKVNLNEPIYWKEGWASDDVRIKSSSGGAASAMMESFVDDGGYVAACLFRNGEFIFDITNKKDEIVRFAGSKYVKSNPVKQLREICFRNKTNFGLSSQNGNVEYKTITPNGVQDMYTYAFLTSLDYTENCYFCQYATLGRVSDVTIGDSWGSNQPDSEQGKGISLILCQTNKGMTLIEKSGLQLEEVDVEMAIEANHQLRHPSIAPETRGIFFEKLNKGFYKAVSKSAPKVYYKQKLKGNLIKFKIIRGGANKIEYKISFR